MEGDKLRDVGDLQALPDGDEEGQFSGRADVEIKTEKALGQIKLNFDEEGRYWGKGSISYQVTKDIRPTLSVELTRDQRGRCSAK